MSPSTLPMTCMAPLLRRHMSYNDEEFEQYFRQKVQKEEEERKRRESEVLPAPDEADDEGKGKQQAAELTESSTVSDVWV